jgi:hypothetical protein
VGGTTPLDKSPLRQAGTWTGLQSGCYLTRKGTKTQFRQQIDRGDRVLVARAYPAAA